MAFRRVCGFAFGMEGWTGREEVKCDRVADDHLDGRGKLKPGAGPFKIFVHLSLSCIPPPPCPCLRLRRPRCHVPVDNRDRTMPCLVRLRRAFIPRVSCMHAYTSLHVICRTPTHLVGIVVVWASIGFSPFQSRPRWPCRLPWSGWFRETGTSISCLPTAVMRRHVPVASFRRSLCNARYMLQLSSRHVRR